MSEAVDTLVVDLRKGLSDMGAALTNIAADEQRQADQITALTKQIADILAAGGTLSDADLESLSTFRNDMVAMAARSKQIADGIAEPAA